ncbi:retrovirus-related pol polyprotein from transposon TNT 1-94 [Tanacetum coccineum]|uniref:Retrovirus-related pol polyprotein from transposon TNT 1-94 n=1 Tax=Tanacetum coccineum TaxID=301880 RepID=A0ABQ4ZU97_9ASTR
MTVNRKFFSTTRHTPGYVINGSNLRGNFIGKSKLSSEHDSEITKDGKDHRQSPSAVRSYGGNRYTLVIVDDYSRCTIVSIRTDHGREFDNEVQFGEFCNANGITHNFSAPRTPQSNGVVERKNRTLQEMSRTMLNEQSLP